VATEAAWLNGNNLEKEETKKKKEKKRQNERKDLTLTGLLMEGRYPYPRVFGLSPEISRQALAKVSASDERAGRCLDAQGSLNPNNTNIIQFY